MENCIQLSSVQFAFCNYVWKGFVQTSTFGLDSRQSTQSKSQHIQVRKEKNIWITMKGLMTLNTQLTLQNMVIIFAIKACVHICYKYCSSYTLPKIFSVSQT